MKSLKHYAQDLFVTNGYWHIKRQSKGRNFIEKVIRDKNAVVKNYIIPLWGDIQPQDLTIKKVDHKLCYIDNIAPATKNKILSTLSEIYTHLIEEEICDKNPTTNIVYYCGQKIKRGILTPQEIQTLFPENHYELLKIWKSQMYATAFLILKDTGLRAGELRALQWKDWHPELRFFPIVKAIEANTRLRIKSTKTGQVKPAIVSPFVAGEIERLRFSVNGADDNFIFTCSSGMPVSDSVLSMHFKEGIKRAGIDRPEITPHWLRHTFNTRALENLTPEIVQALMGHKTQKMLERYRHADETSLKREAEKISKQLLENPIFQTEKQKEKCLDVYQMELNFSKN